MVTILLFFFLSIVVIMDLKSYKISNKLILMGILCGIFYRIIEFQWNSIFTGIIGFIVPFLVLFPLYLLKAIGAGDIKTFMVVGLVCGRTFALSMIFYSLLIGGVISLFYLLYKKQLFIRLLHLIHYLKNCFLLIYYKQLECIPSYLDYTNNNHSSNVKQMSTNSNKIHFSIPILLSFLFIQLFHQFNPY